MTKELKKCPFCLGNFCEKQTRPRFLSGSEIPDDLVTYYNCLSCDYVMSGAAFEYISSRWNKRPDAEKEPDTEAEIREAIRVLQRAAMRLHDKKRER